MLPKRDLQHKISLKPSLKKPPTEKKTLQKSTNDDRIHPKKMMLTVTFCQNKLLIGITHEHFIQKKSLLLKRI